MPYSSELRYSNNASQNERLGLNIRLKSVEPLASDPLYLPFSTMKPMPNENELFSEKPRCHFLLMKNSCCTSFDESVSNSSLYSMSLLSKKLGFSIDASK